jgi:two-component system nitrogen regulation response regulator NtrX
MNTILVIDDEPGIRSTLTSILEDENNSVLAVEDATVGFQSLKNLPMTLVFLDVCFPKWVGWMH